MGLRIRGGRRGSYGGEKPTFTPRVSSRGRRMTSGSRSTNANRLSPPSHVTSRISVAERRKRNEELNQSILKTLDHLMSVDQEEKFCRDIQSELEKTVQDFDAAPINTSFKDKDKGFSHKASTEGSALEVSVNGVLKPVNGSASKSSEDVESRSITAGRSVLNHSGEMPARKQLLNESIDSGANENSDKIAHSSTANGVLALEPRMFYSKEQQENLGVKQLVKRPSDILRNVSNGKNNSTGLNQRRVASMGQQKCYKYFNKLSKRNRINYSKKSSDWNPGISKVSRSSGKDIETSQMLDEDLKKNGRLSSERYPKKYLNLQGGSSNKEMASCPGTSSGNQVIATGDMTALPMILRNSTLALNSDSEKDDEEEDEEGLVECGVARSKNGVKEVVDVIDGIEFVTFENEHDMVQFTRLVSDESGKGDAVDLGFSAEFPEAIVPKKTKDIKKIKGWQKKKFTVTQNPMVDSSVSGLEPLALNDLHPDGIEYEHNYIRRQLEKEDYLIDSEDELPDLTVANLADIQGDKKVVEGGLVGQTVKEKMCLWKPSEKSAFVSFSSSNSDQIGKSQKEVTVRCNDESMDVLDCQTKDPKKLTTKDQSEQELLRDHPSLRTIVALSPTSILMSKMRRLKQVQKDKVLKMSKAVQTDLAIDDGEEKGTHKRRNWKVKALEDELREWSRPYPDVWHVDEKRASFAVSAVKPLKCFKKTHANRIQSDRSQGRHPKRVLRRRKFSQGEGRESTSQRRLLRSSTKPRPPPVRITRSSISASQTTFDSTGPALSSPVKYHNSRKSTGTPPEIENLNSRVSTSELQLRDETASSQSSLLKSRQRLPFENDSSKKSLIRILPLEKLIDKTLLDVSPPDSSQPLGSSSLETLDEPANSMMGYEGSKKLDQPTCSGVESESLQGLDEASGCGIVSESSKLSDQPNISAVASKCLKAMDQRNRACIETACIKTQDQLTTGTVGSESSEASDQPTSVVGVSIPSAESESVICSLSKNSALPEPERNTHSKSNFARRISRKTRRKLRARKMWIIRKMRNMMKKGIVDSFKANQPQVSDVGDKKQLIVDVRGGAEAASGEENGKEKLVQSESMAKGETARKRYSDGKIEDGVSRRTNSPPKVLSVKLKKPFQRKEFSLELEDEDLRVFLKPKPRLQVGAFSPAKSSQDPSMHASGSTSRSEGNHPSELSPPKKTDVEIFKSKSPNSPALARRRLIRELQKLNANFVSVDPEEKSTVNEKCSKEFCRLGCVCDSLRTDKRLVEHCGKVECMFSCVCPCTESASSSAKQLVIGSDTVSRLQEESSRHMARVEKFFHHTVVEAAGELVLPGRQQRERRLPKRFLDESVNPDEIFAKKTKTQDSSGKSTVHQAKKDIPSPSSAQYKKCCVSLGQFPNLQASVRCIYHSRLNCPCLYYFKSPRGVRRNVAMKSTSKVREKQSVPIRGSAFALSMEEISAPLSQNKKNVPASQTLDSCLENQNKALSLKEVPGFQGVDTENNDSVRSKVKGKDVVGQNMAKKVSEKLVNEDASDKDCYCKDVASDHYCEGNEHLHSVRTCGIDLWASQLSLEKLVSKDIVKVSDLNNIIPNSSKDDSPTLPVAESGFKSVHSLLNKVHPSVPQASEGEEKSAPKSVDKAAIVDVEVTEKYPQKVPQESTANEDNDSDLSELVRQDDSMPLFKIVEVKSLPPSSFEPEQNTSAEREKKRAIHKMRMKVPKTGNGSISDSKKDLALKKRITKRKARFFSTVEKFNKWLKSNRTMCGDLERMCSRSLKPLPLNYTILMKWSHLSKLVDSHSAHLWIRQRLNATQPDDSRPNSHIFVTQNDRPPDGACVNFLDLEKKVALCAKVAILLRAAKLGDPKAMGCGILVSKGGFWEITGHIKFGKRMRKDLHDLEPKNAVPGGSSSTSGERDVLEGEGGTPGDIDGEVGGGPSCLEVPKSASDMHKPGEVRPRDWIGAPPTSVDAKTGSSGGINGRAPDPTLEKLDLTKSVVKIELDFETSTLSVLEGVDDPGASMKPKSILGADTGDYKFGKFPTKERANFLTAAQSEHSTNRQGSLILQRRRSDIAERKDSILLTDSMLNLRRVPGVLNNPFMKVKQFGNPGQGLLSPPSSSSSGQAKPTASETFISSGNSFRLNTFSGSLEPPPHILQSEDTETNVIGQQEMQHSSFNYPMSRESSKPTSENKSYLSSSGGTSLNMRKMSYPPLIKLENTSIIQEAKVFNSSSEKEKMGVSTSSARSGNVFSGANPPVLIIDLNKMRHGQPLQGSANKNGSLSFRVGDMKSSSAGGFDAKNRAEVPDAHASKVCISSTSHLIGPSVNFTAPQKNHEVHDTVMLSKLLPKQFSSRNESVLVSRQQMGLPNVINMSASKAIHVNIIKDVNQASQIMRKNPSSDPVNTVNFCEKEGSITEKLDFPIRLPPNMLTLVNAEPRKAFVKLGGNLSEEGVSSNCDKPPVANTEHGVKENKGVSSENQRVELVSSSEHNASRSKSWPKEVTVNIEQSKLSVVSCNIPVSASETPVSKGESYVMRDWPSGLVGTSNESTALQNISRSKEMKNSMSPSKNAALPKSPMQGVSILKEPKIQGHSVLLGTLSSRKLSSVEEGTACRKSQSKGETENLSPRKVQYGWPSPQSGGVREMEGLAKIQAEKPALASGLADVRHPVCTLEGNRTTEKKLECSNEGSSKFLRSTQFIGIINDKESEVDELPRKEAVLITRRRRSRNNTKSKIACKKEARASFSGIKQKVVPFNLNSSVSTFDTSHSMLQSAKKASDLLVDNASHSTPQEAVVSPKKTSTALVKNALQCTSEKVDSVPLRKKTSHPEKSFCVSPRKKAVTQLACDGLPSTPQKAIMLSPKKASTPSPVKLSALSSPKKASTPSPVKLSALSSPKKGSNASPVKLSALSSPKKASTPSPVKLSALSSPKKALTPSPVKLSASSSPKKGSNASPVKGSVSSPRKTPTPSPVKAPILSPRRALTQSPKNCSSESAPSQNWKLDAADKGASLSSAEKAEASTISSLDRDEDSIGQNAVSKDTSPPQRKEAIESKASAQSPGKPSLASSSPEKDEEDYNLHLSLCESADPAVSVPPSPPPSSPSKKKASPNHMSATEEKCFKVPLQQVSPLKTSSEECQPVHKVCAPPATASATSPACSGIAQRGDGSLDVPPSSSPDKPQDLPSNMDVVWYRLSLNGEFDKLISDETGFSTSASRLLSAVMIARTSNRTVRLAFDKKKNSEESQEFKKGIYAVPTVCGSYVKIGPYKRNEPTGVRTLKKVGNHQYKVVPNLLKIDVDAQAGDSLLDNGESSSSVESPGLGKANKSDVSSLPMDSAVVSSEITSKKPPVKSWPSEAGEEPLVPMESENNVSCAASSPEKKHSNMPLKIPVLSIPRLSLDYEKKMGNGGERGKKLMESRPSTKASSEAESKLEAVVAGEECDELSHAVREGCGSSNRKQKDDISPVVHAAKKQCTESGAVVPPSLREGDKNDVKASGSNLDSTSSNDGQLVVVGRNLKSTQQVQVGGDEGSPKLDSGSQAIKDTQTSRKENVDINKSEPLNMDVSDKSFQNKKKKASTVSGSTARSVSSGSKEVQVKDLDVASAAEMQRDVGSTGEEAHSEKSGQVEITSMIYDSAIDIDDSKFERGYLIPSIPKLAPYPVKRSAGPGDSFSFVVEDLSEEGSRARFEDLEAVGQHMNEVLHNYVRFFPAHFQIEWTYAKDLPSAPGTIKIKSLTKDQFITYKGVFRYSLGEDMSSKLNKLLHDSVEVKTVTCRYSRALEEAKAQLLAILVREGGVAAGVMDTLTEVIDKALGEISSLRSHDELLSEDSVFIKKKHRELLKKLEGLLRGAEEEDC
ncbi:uncharacterized protein LOC124161867 isoform X2 [Ischnura elegans]|uniref:uncharacterized protein LOC124161867 isoform X2 n=1 Tax=Ischnura elegans TaxID=197161 RepID=UPI001ED87913|nr:uncharacterized protein LOC124161867 isoform X2 [Ischnura elegans]